MHAAFWVLKKKNCRSPPTERKRGKKKKKKDRKPLACWESRAPRKEGPSSSRLEGKERKKSDEASGGPIDQGCPLHSHPIPHQKSSRGARPLLHKEKGKRRKVGGPLVLHKPVFVGAGKKKPKELRPAQEKKGKGQGGGVLSLILKSRGEKRDRVRVLFSERRRKIYLFEDALKKQGGGKKKNG